MRTLIATAVTILAIFATQAPASAGDYWHGGGHRVRQSYRHTDGGHSSYTPRYNYGYAPSNGGYSPRYVRRGVDNGYGGYVGGGYRDVGGYGHGEGYSGYGRNGGVHHGHSALHLDVGPFHFGLGR